MCPLRGQSLRRALQVKAGVLRLLGGGASDGMTEAEGFRWRFWEIGRIPFSVILFLFVMLGESAFYGSTPSKGPTDWLLLILFFNIPYSGVYLIEGPRRVREAARNSYGQYWRAMLWAVVSGFIPVIAVQLFRPRY